MSAIMTNDTLEPTWQDTGRAGDGKFTPGHRHSVGNRGNCATC